VISEDSVERTRKISIHHILDTYLVVCEKNTIIFKKKKDFLNKRHIYKNGFLFFINMLYYIRLFLIEISTIK